MKPNIHPDNYRPVLFYDNAAKTGWVINSTVSTTKTMKWEDGQEYPMFSLDTSSASHPAYTGKTRQISREGRSSRFNNRFGSAIINSLKKV